MYNSKGEWIEPYQELSPDSPRRKPMDVTGLLADNVNCMAGTHTVTLPTGDTFKLPALVFEFFNSDPEAPRIPPIIFVGSETVMRNFHGMLGHAVAGAIKGAKS